MPIAEHYAMPLTGHLSGYFQRVNDFNDGFLVRWGKIDFDVFYGAQVNVKVVLKVYRTGVCETYVVDTDAYDIQWNRHKRRTRDFYILPDSKYFGHINCVKFAYVIHLGERSIASQNEYIYMDGHQIYFEDDQYHQITREYSTINHYRTYELSGEQLQHDVDWYNQHFEVNA